MKNEAAVVHAVNRHNQAHSRLDLEVGMKEKLLYVQNMYEIHQFLKLIKRSSNDIFCKLIRLHVKRY